jgi:preprotein translocase subunit SecD
VLLIFNWDATGSQLSQQITTRLYNNSNAPLGIFEGDQALIGENGVPIAPSVKGIISDRGQIEGLSPTESRKLSSQLNAGRLPVPLTRTGDEQDIEPSLGGHFVTTSVRTAIIALLVVMVYMITYYRLSGVVASAALLNYAVLLLAIFKLLNVTMTLSAIGGFVLSLGMAVDANVLIFERMKEELWGGRTLGAAIDAGFNRAWPAIRDSNVTSILAGAILLWLGSSNIASSAPVKGFAVTLIIGVVSSMFTAITVTRTLLRPFAAASVATTTSLFAPFQGKKNA